MTNRRHLDELEKIVKAEKAEATKAMFWSLLIPLAFGIVAAIVTSAFSSATVYGCLLIGGVFFFISSLVFMDGPDSHEISDKTMSLLAKAKIENGEALAKLQESLNRQHYITLAQLISFLYEERRERLRLIALEAPGAKALITKLDSNHE